ncbi:UNVERIFIED_CONTAM: hypothetical protein RMT77_005461 [Armadillidium vulgare]
MSKQFPIFAKKISELSNSDSEENELSDSDSLESDDSFEPDDSFESGDSFEPDDSFESDCSMVSSSCELKKENVENLLVSDNESVKENKVKIENPSTTWSEIDGDYCSNFSFFDVSGPPEKKTTQSHLTQPIDAFNLMVTDDVYNLIVKQTNLNAQQMMVNKSVSKSSRLKDWRDTDVEEIKNFLGIVMYMGIINHPSISTYWSKKSFYKNYFVPEIMSRNRFQLLLRFIRFADYREGKTDRLVKVKNLLEILENNFVTAKIPELTSADRNMVPYHGHLSVRQYNLEKTHKFGVKVYKLCDTNGYTYVNSVNYGKSGVGQSGGLRANSSHTMENTLLKKLTHLVGILKDVTNPKVKKEICCEIDDGIEITKGKDKLLSEKNDLSTISTEKQNKSKEDIKKPKLDISDQMVSYFSPLRKTVKWYKKVAFEFLLNTSVVNALIIYKEFQNKKVNISEFRESVIESLCVMKKKVPARISTKHKLQECSERDKRNRKVRKRCSNCYTNLKKTVDRLQAMKKCKKVTTYCDTCEGKPALCMQCFFKKH